MKSLDLLAHDLKKPDRFPLATREKWLTLACIKMTMDAMTLPELRITVLPDSGDHRGSSYQTGKAWIDFLGSVDDAHIATILPGAIRGNHFHVRRREVIAVLHSDAWRVAWDRGAGTAVTVREFAGEGAVLLEVDPLASHAIGNTGQAPLWIIGLSNEAFDAEAPDSLPRQVLPVPLT